MPLSQSKLLANSGRSASTFEMTISPRMKPYSPPEEMAKLAMDKKVAESIRVKLLADLANYVYPKRKAVEMDVPEETLETVQEFLDSLKEVP